MQFLTLQPLGFQVGLDIMRIKSVGISDVGCKREKNEDSFFISDDLGLYIVADGMGGHVAGELASRLAVKTVEELVSELTRDPNVTLPESADIKIGEYKSWLRFAIGIASQKIFEKSKQDTALQGMGTTTVGLLFRKNKIYVANVGDSRGYRIRGNKMEQMTTDHSLVGEQIRAGIIKPTEAKEHRLKNIITRSVGFQEDVEVDIEAKMVKEGDCYLLCSDGLYNMIADDEILDVVKNHVPEEACKHLVDIAKSRGGDDNITIVLAKVTSLEESVDEEESTMKC